MYKKYSRRNFIKKAVQTSIGLAGLKLFPNLLNSIFADEKIISTIAVARKGSPGKLVRKAIEALGGIQKFVVSGDEVVIKPNISWDRTPEQGANTNPLVLREVLLMCLEAGVKNIKIIDRPCNDPERSYNQSGAVKVVEEINDSKIELLQVDPRKYKKMNIPNATYVKTCLFYEDFINPKSKLISIPVAKHHSSTGLTMSIKNAMGMIGGQRSLMHENIHHKLVDLNRMIPQHLVILDAIRIVLRNGPQGGDIKDTKIMNTIIAGTDRVAIDSYGATLFNMKGNDLEYLRYAYESGMGEINLDKINIMELG